MSLKQLLAGFVVAATCAWVFGGAGRSMPKPPADRAVPEHWVSTWATALQLMPPAPAACHRPAAVRPAAPVPSDQRPPPAGSQASVGPPPPGPAPAGTPPIGPPPTQSAGYLHQDQTLRMVVRTSIGGRRIRVSAV